MKKDPRKDASPVLGFQVKLRSEQPYMKPWMAILLIVAVAFALFGPAIVTLIRRGF